MSITYNMSQLVSSSLFTSRNMLYMDRWTTCANTKRPNAVGAMDALISLMIRGTDFFILRGRKPQVAFPLSFKFDKNSQIVRAFKSVKFYDEQRGLGNSRCGLLSVCKFCELKCALRLPFSGLAETYYHIAARLCSVNLL